MAFFPTAIISRNAVFLPFSAAFVRPGGGAVSTSVLFEPFLGGGIGLGGLGPASLLSPLAVSALNPILLGASFGF